MIYTYTQPTIHSVQLLSMSAQYCYIQHLSGKYKGMTSLNFFEVSFRLDKSAGAWI